ncbi:hypothetical protein EC988_005325 [Linderina pennispora]|nr:hypothetical protein EC988_005325 [Linderina pennispora]
MLDNEQYRQLVIDTARHKSSHYYYSAEVPAQVISADAQSRSAVIQTTVTDSEICASGCIDEGWVATVADYWTSTMISVANEGKSAVTTSLSVQAVKSIEPGCVVLIKCQVTDTGLSMPHAIATFESESGDIYALATHTKFFKPLRK